MRQKWNILAAKSLIVCFLTGMALPALPGITAFAVPMDSRIDYWELMEEEAGEVVIGFPSRVEAVLEGNEDRDRFVFTLEDSADLPCLIMSRS